ncbi:MAG: S8 family serine peptidase [Candidatus Hodarchaeota archaeon]
MRKRKAFFALLLTTVFLTSMSVVITPAFTNDVSPTATFMSKLEPELLAKLQEHPDSVYRVVVVLNDGCSKAEARDLLLSLGGEISAEHNLINAISVSIPGDKLQSVTSLGAVNKILLDGKKFLIPVPKEENDQNVLITVFDHEYSNWDHPAIATITIPDRPIESCRMVIEAHSDPDEPFLRAIHFFLDDIGDPIGVYRQGPGQVRGSVTLRPGETKTWEFDMSHCMFAKKFDPEDPAGSTGPVNGIYYRNFIPQDEDDIIGYFSPGGHTVKAYVTSQDIYSGPTQDSWISIKLYFEFKVEYYSPFPFWHEADKAWDMGVDGSGVTVAILDTGLYYEHPDLSGVVIGYEVFTSEVDVFPHDGYGHGTACASCVAAQGIVDWDLGVPGYIFKVKGVAPGAKVIGGKVLTDAGWGWDSWIIQGIEWAVCQGTDIISCSFGGLEIPNDGNDPTALALDAATKKGVTVFASSGNSQGFGTVGSPSCAKDVISVGASTENEWPLEWLGYWPAEYMNGSILYENDQLIFWSSGGATPDGRVDPDVCAIGAWGLTLNTYDDYLSLQFGGTSMACPVAAGVGALVIQAYRDTYGASPKPGIVKNILMNTAEDIGYPANRQGAGRVDAHEAVLAAKCERCYSDRSEIHTGILKPGQKYKTKIGFKENINDAYAIRFDLFDIQLFEGLSVEYPGDLFFFSIPDGAEYAEVKLKFPPEYVFGPIKDYDGSQWTDTHINTVLYRIEEDEGWTMINYAYAHTNIQWLDARVTPGDYVLWMWLTGPYTVGLTVEPVDIEISSYESVPWDWVSTHISGKHLKVKVKAPWYTNPGSYSGFVIVECDGDFISIPLVVTVPAKICKPFTVNANVVMEPRDYISGDWIFIPVKVSRHGFITLTVSWLTDDADFDVYLIAPDGEVEALSEAPAADESPPEGVFSGGGKEWYTTTGDTLEVLSAYACHRGYWYIGIRAVYFGNTFDQTLFVSLKCGSPIRAPNRVNIKAGGTKNFMVENKIPGEVSVETMVLGSEIEWFSDEYTGTVDSVDFVAGQVGYDFVVIPVTPDILCMWAYLEGDDDLQLILYDPAGANRGVADKGRYLGVWDPTIGHWEAIITIHEVGSSEYTLRISGVRVKEFTGLTLNPTSFTLGPMGSQAMTLTADPGISGLACIIYYDMDTGSIYFETDVLIYKWCCWWCW